MPSLALFNEFLRFSNYKMSITLLIYNNVAANIIKNFK